MTLLILEVWPIAFALHARMVLALEGVALSPRVSVLAAMAALRLRAVAFDWVVVIGLRRSVARCLIR